SLLVPVLFVVPHSPRIYTLSLHDALPISRSSGPTPRTTPAARRAPDMCGRFAFFQEIQPLLDDLDAVDLTDGRLRSRWNIPHTTDRKSTRLNSSHVSISYAVFCLKTKIKT